MRYLLDTQVLVWWLEDSRHLGNNLRSLIQEPSNEIFYSPVNILEIEIKKELEKIRLDEHYFDVVLNESFKEVVLTSKHTHKAGNLPYYHSDAFDRILIAQAEIEKMILLTNDRKLKQYAIKTIMNQP